MSDQDYENTIAHLDERIAQLEAENAQLRLEIIAATGQAQTALEESAKLKSLLAFAREHLDVRLCPEWAEKVNALMEEE